MPQYNVFHVAEVMHGSVQMTHYVFVQIQTNQTFQSNQTRNQKSNAPVDEWNFRIQSNQTNPSQEIDHDTGLHLSNGVWFNVHEHKLALEILDKLWLLMAVVFPMLQSGYLSFKTFNTHLITFTIRDNQRAFPIKPIKSVI